MDDTFLRAPRSEVRRGTSSSWITWLPDLHLVVSQDRGEEGVRWAATSRSPGGASRSHGGAWFSGSAEVWLEEVPGGTLAHLYVRLDPGRLDPVRLDRTAGQEGGTGRHARYLPDRVRRTWKRGLHAWKDSQEGDRST